MTREEREALNRMSLFFGHSLGLTKEFFESLYVYIVLEYVSGREINLPFIGNLKLEYKGEKFTRHGKFADVGVNLDLSPEIIRNIGQLEDEELTDAERLLLSRVTSVFSSYEREALPEEVEP